MKVTVAHRGPPGRRMELLGDLPDWNHPIAMIEVEPGLYTAEIDAPPGVHRYKVRADGVEWRLDHGAPIDRAEGAENNLLFVEAAPPPLWFAPDRRHVGPSRVHAEIDPGVAAPEVPVAGERVALSAVAEIGGRLLLRGARPTPEPAEKRPAWLDGAVIYAIFVDRWRRGRDSPPGPDRDAASTRDTSYGGDLDGVRESLPYIRSLGATAVLLTPVQPARSPHRYDGLDLGAVDPALGGEEAFARLAAEARTQGLKLLVDLAATHVHEDHPAFQDVLLRQQSSPHARWFRVRRFPVRLRDPATYDAYPENPDLPWLDLADPGARAHVVAAAERWIERGANGLRLDAMNDAPLELWTELAAKVRERAPRAALIGEVISDRPAHFAAAADACTDFFHREAIVAFFAHRRIDAQAFAERVRLHEHRVGPFDPAFRLLFLDNHDTARFFTLAQHHDAVRLALAYLFFRPEPLMLTYGTELGMASGLPSTALDDAWPERLPMPPLPGADTETRRLIRDMARLRLDGAQAREEIRWVHAAGPLLVLERGDGARAYFNAGDEAVVPSPPPPHGARVILSVNRAEGAPADPLPPRSSRWLGVA